MSLDQASKSDPLSPSQGVVRVGKALKFKPRVLILQTTAKPRRISSDLERSDKKK
jgi:hypothetical protein